MNLRRTEQLAKLLAARLKKQHGGVVLLYGPMGSGKTTLVSLIVKELDPTATPSSPTYNLINQYGEKIYHADLYRLHQTDADATQAEIAKSVVNIGLMDLVLKGNYVFIEWADGLVIPNAIHIKVVVKGNGDREFIIA